MSSQPQPQSRSQASTLKWVATATLIIGTAINSLGFYPLGPLVLILGGIMWSVVSVLWRDKALLTTNVVMTLVAILSIAIHYGINHG